MIEEATKMHVRLPKSLPKTRKAVWEAYNAPPRTVLHREPRSEHTLYQTGTCRNNDRLLARGLTRELRQRNILPRSYVFGQKSRKTYYLRRHLSDRRTKEQKGIFPRIPFPFCNFRRIHSREMDSNRPSISAGLSAKRTAPVSFQEIPVAETP